LRYLRRSLKEKLVEFLPRSQEKPKEPQVQN
jgi:hypothetical protein